MKDKLLELSAQIIVHVNSIGNNFELGEKIREEYNRIFKSDEKSKN